MSSNKTEHYQLHSWEASDNFLRSEFNENFAILDAKAVQVAVGSYEGDGETSRTIDLGFQPRLVILTNGEGVLNTHTGTYGGVVMPGYSTSAITVTDTGFTVSCPGGYSSLYTNNSNTQYRYFAFR